MTSASPEELLKRLDEQHQAYLETFKLVHEALSNSLVNKDSTPQSPLRDTIRALPLPRRRSTKDRVESDIAALKASTLHSSVFTGDSEDSDDDDDLYVQTPLAPFQYDHEDLRHHLRNYKFTESGLQLLDTVITPTGRLLDPNLFPQYDKTDRSHNSHYSVFDVGRDGAPISRREAVVPGTTEIDSAIWQAIKDLNVDPNSNQQAVGRITIVREPSPVIFGAIHLTMNQFFDVDELFDHLLSDEVTSVNISNRPFSVDNRRQRSFVFSFEYFTIVGEECQPMPWQLADRTSGGTSNNNVPISRCSSVVALSLAGEPIRRLRNPARRARTTNGFVYDPWAPWHVLNIQCFPDHRHSMDSHDSTKHYVNGPEAFLHTLLSEFKDAEKRFDAIYIKISKVVTPPPEIMFDAEIRDKLLFEDEEFTYSRRYFWAYQTLSIIKDGIKAIIDGYEDTFTEDVWEGKHKTLWPMLDYDSHRNKYWRKRMQKLRGDFEKQIRHLTKQYEETEDKMKEIRTLRDQLFSGTSVLESRKSVEMAAVTILQGHNVKLLTMVSIFFLPLTFVTSVYGMTNMPTQHDFSSFGLTIATVCVPFFLLIGFLNTTSGMQFWRTKWYLMTEWISRKSSRSSSSHSSDNGRTSKSSSFDTLNSMKPPAPAYTFATREAIAARKDLTSPQSQPLHSPIYTSPPRSPPRARSPLQQSLTIPLTPASPPRYQVPFTSVSSMDAIANQKPTLTRSPSWWEGIVKKDRKRRKTSLGMRDGDAGVVV